MSGIEFVDRHEAKIRSITMEAPEGYEFGHVVKAEIELRVGKLEYVTDKEGNLVRTAVLVIESAHIKEAVDPSVAYASTASSTDDDDDDSDDVFAEVTQAVTSPDGRQVDPKTGEFLSEADEPAELEREPVDVGF